MTRHYCPRFWLLYDARNASPTCEEWEAWQRMMDQHRAGCETCPAVETEEVKEMEHEN